MYRGIHKEMRFDCCANSEGSSEALTLLGTPGEGGGGAAVRKTSLERAVG